MKGIPLLGSGLVHLGLMLALMRVAPPATPTRSAPPALIIFEPVSAPPSAAAEPPPEPEATTPPAPEASPPEASPEPAAPAPSTPAPKAPSPAPEPQAEASPSPEPSVAPGPKRLDLTLSNEPGPGVEGEGGGAKLASGSGSGAGDGKGAGSAAAAETCKEARTKPKPLTRVTIEYPAAAQSAGIEGRVVLRAEVDARGEVREVIVVESAGPEIDGPAAAALARWRFEAATRCGEPVAAPYVIAREFRLGA